MLKINQKGSSLILIIIIVAVVIAVGAIFILWISKKQNTIPYNQTSYPVVSPTPNISNTITLPNQELKFNNQIIFNFTPNNPMTVTQKDENTYILDKDNPIRSYIIVYYQSKDDFLKNQVYIKNSDGSSAGQGCFYDDKSDIVINNTHFNQLQCYYNPIDQTKTGNYIPSTSVLSNNYCVYNLGAQGVIYFGGTLPVDSNGCDMFFKTDLKNFEILNTISWKTYTNSTYNFTVKYPSSWKVDESTFYTDNSYKGIAFTSQSMAGSITIYISQQEFSLYDKNQKSNFTIGGVNSYRISSRIPPHGPYENIGFKKDNNYFVIQRTEVESQENDTFNAFLSSFKFTQ